MEQENIINSIHVIKGRVTEACEIAVLHCFYHEANSFIKITTLYNKFERDIQVALSSNRLNDIVNKIDVAHTKFREQYNILLHKIHEE